MNEITEKMLHEIADYKGEFKGAFNIRENGCSVARASSEHIKIEPKSDEPGWISAFCRELPGKPFPFRPA